jgi:hypothetical protein
MAGIAGRTEDVGAQHHAVVHRDWGVPIDAHSIARFAFHPIISRPA